jgi:hypothetical protein
LKEKIQTKFLQISLVASSEIRGYDRLGKTRGSTKDSHNITKLQLLPYQLKPQFFPPTNFEVISARFFENDTFYILAGSKIII